MILLRRWHFVRVWCVLWAASALSVLLSCNPGPSDPAPIPIAAPTVVLPGSALPPSIAAVNPATALTTTAQMVTMTGGNFSGVTRVRLLTTPPTELSAITVKNDNTLTVVVPAALPTGSYRLDAENGAGVGASLMELAIEDPPAVPPVVQSLTPDTVLSATATEILISGNHLLAVSQVVLDDKGDPALRTRLTGIRVESRARMRATVPKGVGAGSYNVLVTTPGGSNDESLQKLTVTAQDSLSPVVQTIAPAFGVNTGVTAVQISGQRFTGASKVFLNDTDATALANLVVTGDTLLSAEVPAQLTPGVYGVFVTTSSGTNVVSGATFTVTAPVFPAAAGAFLAGNTAVSITGQRSALTMTGDVYYPANAAGTDAPLDSSGAPYPVLVFAHEKGLDRSFAVAHYQHLATWGYLVIAADFVSGAGTTAANDADKVRDLLDHVLALDAQIGGRFENMVDETLIGALGHGRGGAGALLAASQDARIDAVSALAPEDSAVVVGRAVQIIAASKDEITAPLTHQQPLYDRQNAPKTLITIQGGNHLQFLDLDASATLSGDGTATITREAQTTLARTYFTAFFQTYLRGRVAEFSTFVNGAQAQADDAASVTSLQKNP